MTTLTRHSRVRTGQWEVAEVVIEIRVMPIGGVMAGGTIRAILAVMFIILLVAGDTLHRRALELAVQMAGFTSHVRVFSFKFERRQVVIERRRSPAIRRMTGSTIHAKPALVRLVVMMTGITILKRHREIT